MMTQGFKQVQTLISSVNAALNNKEQQYVSKEYRIASIRDKVGSGDCFMAGLIYGLYHQHAPQHMVDFAAAAAVGKMNEVGDDTRQTDEMVNQRTGKF
jgi:2-dehydro-3-deoxygluconokinase